jgi:hypothetical protein
LVPTSHDVEKVGPKKKANPLGIVPMSNFTARGQQELWRGMTPLNTLTNYTGAGGSGKTTLVTHLMSKVTVGELDGDLLGIPSNVLYCTYENDPNTSMRPKLIAAGADADRFFVLGKKHNFKLPGHLPQLTAQIEAMDIRVLVLDPMMAFMDQKRSVNNYGYVQETLNEVMAECSKLGVTVIGVSHITKGAKDASADSQVGSVAFTTTARCVVMVGKTKDGMGVAGVTKVNEGTPYTGWVFNIDHRPIGRDRNLKRLIHAPHVELIRPAQAAEVKAMFADVIDVVADARVQKLLVYVADCGVVDTGRAQRMLMDEFKIRERMARTTIGNAVAAKLIEREHNGGKGEESGYKLMLTPAGERLLEESDDLPEPESGEDFEDLPEDTFEPLD